MVFSSAVFLFIFLPIVIIGYYGVAKHTGHKNMWLLITSIVFYSWGEPLFIFVILLSSIINWFLGEMVKSTENRKRRVWFFLVLLLDISTLLVTKYTGFIVENINQWFHTSISVSVSHLPIGISFYSFQVISYQIEVFRGNVKEKTKCRDFMLYALMFPQLVAGPIVRYKDVESEIKNRAETKDNYSAGVIRFVYGLSKKLILADHLAMIADNAYYLIDHDGITSASVIWIGAISYTLQIYYDFSGYSDMAIGLGKMFGFHFPENFDHPYIASSITEFWRRWHITLSGWFRDYIYIPLGGSRGRFIVNVRNLFVVWILTGLWHGAGWNFVVWGLAYGCLILIERILFKEKKPNPLIGHLYTLFFVNLLWVFFRSRDLSSAWRYIGYMFGTGDQSHAAEAIELIKNAGILPLAAILFCFPVGDMMVRKWKIKEEKAKDIKALIAAPLFILCAVLSIADTYSPFIYFNF